jgi:hypothetical protein
LAFISFSLTGIERMEGTVEDEVVEDVAREHIMETRKNSLKTISIPCDVPIALPWNMTISLSRSINVDSIMR